MEDFGKYAKGKDQTFREIENGENVSFEYRWLTSVNKQPQYPYQRNLPINNWSTIIQLTNQQKFPLINKTSKFIDNFS